jgi:hypothetical protein
MHVIWGPQNIVYGYIHIENISWAPETVSGGPDPEDGASAIVNAAHLGVPELRGGVDTLAVALERPVKDERA